jgi:hypothetical protein
VTTARNTHARIVEFLDASFSIGRCRVKERRQFIFSRTSCLFKNSVSETGDCRCGLVVRVPGYRSRGPGFDSRRYKVF